MWRPRRRVGSHIGIDTGQTYVSRDRTNVGHTAEIIIPHVKTMILLIRRLS